MKFTSVFALASVAGFASVLAAPAHAPKAAAVAPAAVAPAPAVAAIAPQVTAAPNVRPVLVARDMDPQEAQQLVDGLLGNQYNCNGRNRYNNNNNNNNNYGNSNSDWNDDSSDSWGCGDGSWSGSSMQDVQNYVSNAASQLNSAQQALRNDMNGRVPRVVQDYLRTQSSRIAQASRIANGGQQAMTRSASQFVSIASAYNAAQASFTPQAHRIEQQIQQGTYNAAAGTKAPTVLTLGGALGAMLVWAAL